MYNVYHEKVPDVFEGFFVYSYQVHEHNTRTAINLHVPPNASNLCRTGIRYQGVIIWNQILNAKSNIDSSEESFKMLKKCIQIKLIQWWNYSMFCAWIHLRSWSIKHAITASLNHIGSISFTYTGNRYVKNKCSTLHFLHPRTGYSYIRYICVPDTGPINPHGFLAPFCHLILYYTDTIIWTWTLTWGSWHLCIAVMYQYTLLHVILTQFFCMACLIQGSCSYVLNDEHPVAPNGK